jgi:hypothetical protein
MFKVNGRPVSLVGVFSACLAFFFCLLIGVLYRLKRLGTSKAVEKMTLL